MPVHRRGKQSHQRPPGTSDETVKAVGQVTEALEWVERARGHLYEFHHQMGHADRLLGEAAQTLERAGHLDAARHLRHEIIGINTLDGRWTFEIVEEFDDGYYARIRDVESSVRSQLIGGRRHVFEAEMKRAEQSDEG